MKIDAVLEDAITMRKNIVDMVEDGGYTSEDQLDQLERLIMETGKTMMKLEQYESMHVFHDMLSYIKEKKQNQ